MADIGLVHDVLDKQLFDRNHCKMGRVDGIVIDISGGRQPHVVHLECGGTVVWRRLHVGLERLAIAIRKHIGPESDAPYVIPWAKVLTLGKNVTVDLDAKRSNALRWETWLEHHVIGRIPGASPANGGKRGKPQQ